MIAALHPKYETKADLWVKVMDAYEGEDKIKSKGAEYLLPTSGMLYKGMEAGQPGYSMYRNYLARAIFPDYVGEAVRQMVAALHHKPAVIELPERMQPLLNSATNRGEGLEQLLRRINEAQLVSGRVGLLVDLPVDAPITELPFIAIYKAPAIINWAEKRENESNLQLVALKETEMMLDGVTWDEKEIVRILYFDQTEGVYKQGVFELNEDFMLSRLITPRFGNKPFDEIPFTFINPADLLPDPVNPPLLGLANTCYGIYRADADYRLHLFQQAQDTLVVARDNVDEPIAYGYGSVINVPTNGGDAKFIGVSGAGLGEQREDLAAMHKMAAEMSGKLQDVSATMQSGKALLVRVAAQQMSLMQIALTGAAGMQKSLRQIARLIGLNPDEVIVSPNLDFSEGGLTAAELLTLTEAKLKGLPLTEEDLHNKLREADLTEKDYVDALELLKQEREQPILQ